jgi:hypothetical protein
MVVLITISGVALAGLQLAASYRLAVIRGTEFATASELVLNKSGDLVLKSSVTGLFILIISFAFFLVFVLYVYDIKERRIESGSPAASDSQAQGGYGHVVPVKPGENP